MRPVSRTPPHLFTLSLLTALAVLSLNLFLPSLPAMAQEFGVSYSVMNISVAGFMLVSAVLQLVMGPLSDLYGRRPVLLWVLAIFVLASLGCALAQDIHVFLGFRMLQGCIISGVVLSRAAIRDMAGERHATRLIGHVALVMAVVPMLGPALGGALDVVFGWRADFWLLALAGAGLLVLCWWDLGETNLRRSRTFGAQFSAYPGLLRSPLFWAYALCLTFSVGAFYAFLGGGPLVATGLYDLSPVLLGLGLGSITGGFMVGSYVSGRLARRHSLSRMLISGRVVACVSVAAGLVGCLVGLQSPLALFLPVIGVGIGNGMTLPAATAGAISVDPGLAGSASGLTTAMMVAGGAGFAGFAAGVVPLGSSMIILFLVMLAISLAGLVAAIAAARLRGA